MFQPNKEGADPVMLEKLKDTCDDTLANKLAGTGTIAFGQSCHPDEQVGFA